MEMHSNDRITGPSQKILTRKWREFVLNQGLVPVARVQTALVLLAATDKIPELDSQERLRLGQIGDETRRQEWMTGLKAQRLVLEARSGDLPGGRVTSLAHSAGWVLAVSAGGVRAVGVDIEPTHRPLGEMHEARLFRKLTRFADEADRATQAGVGALGLWALKEACFKASAGRPGQWISQWRVVRLDPANLAGECEAPDGEIVFFQIARFEGWWVAFALIRA